MPSPLVQQQTEAEPGCGLEVTVWSSLAFGDYGISCLCPPVSWGQNGQGGLHITRVTGTGLVPNCSVVTVSRSTSTRPTSWFFVLQLWTLYVGWKLQDLVSGVLQTSPSTVCALDSHLGQKPPLLVPVEPLSKCLPPAGTQKPWARVPFPAQTQRTPSITWVSPLPGPVGRKKMPLEGSKPFRWWGFPDGPAHQYGRHGFNH